MAYRDPDKRREVIRQAYRANPAGRMAQIRAREREIAAWVRTLKVQCQLCSENHPACLDFHHRDPVAKEFSVSYAARRGWSRARIEEEIAKCDVLCANCHRKAHWVIQIAPS